MGNCFSHSHNYWNSQIVGATTEFTWQLSCMSLQIALDFLATQNYYTKILCLSYVLLHLNYDFLFFSWNSKLFLLQTMEGELKWRCDLLYMHLPHHPPTRGSTIPGTSPIPGHYEPTQNKPVNYQYQLHVQSWEQQKWCIMRVQTVTSFPILFCFKSG